MSLKTETDRIEGMLLVGDFKGAIRVLKSTAQRERFLRTLSRGQVGKALRARAAGGAAEICFYLGDNDWGWKFVERAATPAAAMLRFGDEVPVRAKLQLVEYEYSHRRFKRGADMALKIRHECARRADLLGAAYASYYLARCHMRLHEPLKVYEACEQCIENLGRSKDITDPAVKWGMGRALLVAGFAAWDAGHDTAWLKLCTARALFGNAPGCDVVGRGNVAHAIGIFRRSRNRSEEEGERALKAFNVARSAYENVGHKLNLARIQTDIGRAYLNMQAWKKAGEQFAGALKTASGIPDADSLTRQRQRAETLVAMAWLNRECDTPDIPRAIECAEEALKETGGEPRRMTVEAHLVLGDCLDDIGDVPGALANFDEARRKAMQRGLVKLQANAWLSLADVNARHGDAAQATPQYLEGLKLLSPGSGGYLRAKAERVRKEIEALKSDLWILNKKELFKIGIKDVRRDLARWVIEKVEHEKEAKTFSEKGALIGIKAAAYLKLKRRNTGETRGVPLEARLPSVSSIVKNVTIGS